MPYIRDDQAIVQVVFDRDDKERIQQAAKAAGMSTATWVRVQVLAALPRLAKSRRAPAKNA